MKVSELSDLPPTLTVAQTAEVLGCGTDSIYDACKRGEFPHIRIGSRVVVPTLKLVAMLGLDENEPDESAMPGPLPDKVADLRRIS